MAFDRAAPPALRWVALFLAICAALGLWLGFKDQMRRNPPAWYTGGSEPTAAATPGGVEARDAVAFDPNAPARPLTGAAPSDTASAEVKAEAKTDEKADALTPAQAFAADTQPLDVPAAPKPKPAPTPTPTPKPAPSDDPVGDILDGQKPADTPPPVPY